MASAGIPVRDLLGVLMIGQLPVKLEEMEMATLIKTTFEQLPEGVVEIGVDWENSSQCDESITEVLSEGPETVVYVVCENHYNGERYEQWSKTYYV